MSNSTIGRGIVIIIGLVNTVCALLGWTPLDVNAEVVYGIISALIAVGTTIWGWWKNNSVTKPAITADRVMVAINQGLVTVEQVEAFVAKMEKRPKNTTTGAK